MDEPSRFIFSGSKLTLKCDLTRPKSNVQHLKLKWLKKVSNTLVEVNDTDNLKVYLEPKRFTLEMSQINDEVSGTYVCKVDTDYGEHYIEQELVVYGKLIELFTLKFN